MLNPKIFMSREFLIFLICGAIAAAVNFLSRILFSYVGLDFRLAVFLASICGLITAFTLFRTVAFRGTTAPLSRSILGFLLVNALALILTYVVSTSLYYHLFPALSWHWHSAEISHFIGIGVPALTSFIGHKYLSFRR